MSQNKVEEMIFEEMGKQKDTLMSMFNECAKNDLGIYLDGYFNYNSITVKVCEKVERWSEDIVSIASTIGDNPSFNHGSGGWNGTGNTDRQLEIMSVAFGIAKSIHDVIIKNRESINELIVNHRNLSSELTELVKVKRIAQTQENVTKTKCELMPFIKTLTVANISSFMSPTTDIYEKVMMFQVNYDETVSAVKVELEVSHGLKTVYKINDKRFSKKDFFNYVANNEFYAIPTGKLHSTVFRKNYTVENLVAKWNEV